MDRDIVAQKLESLRRCIKRIEEKCPSTAEALQHDIDAQDIVSLNLTRAIQLCVDIGAHLIAETESPPPETMGQTFDLLAAIEIIDSPLALRMKKAVGFRNLAVHDYDAINWTIVHALASRNLGDFREFAKSVVTQLANDQ